MVRKCQLQLLATELSAPSAPAAGMHEKGSGECSIANNPAGHHRKCVFVKHQWSAWTVLLEHAEGQGQLPCSSISFSCPGEQAQIALVP